MKEKSAARLEMFKAILQFSGVAIIPLAVIVCAILFSGPISEKIRGVQAFQVGRYGITFSVPQELGGNIDLDPRALYYLLATAKSRDGGGFNYDTLSDNDKRAILDLLRFNFITAKWSSAPTVGIRKSIDPILTKKGGDFLRATKLDRILDEGEGSVDEQIAKFVPQKASERQH